MVHELNNKVMIFDFDGVIVDSFSIGMDVYQELRRKYSLPEIVTSQDLHKFFNQNLFESLMELGLSPEKTVAYFTDVNEELFKRREEMVPMPGILETFQTLSEKKHTLSIVSSNHSRVINFFLRKHKVDAIFIRVLGADFNMSKTIKIISLIDDFNADRGGVYYIGDTIGDIIEAKRAGVKSVAACWGYHDKDLLAEHEPDFIFDHRSA